MQQEMAKGFRRGLNRHQWDNSLKQAIAFEFKFDVKDLDKWKLDDALFTLAPEEFESTIRQMARSQRIKQLEQGYLAPLGIPEYTVTYDGQSNLSLERLVQQALYNQRDQIIEAILTRINFHTVAPRNDLGKILAEKMNCDPAQWAAAINPPVNEAAIDVLKKYALRIVGHTVDVDKTAEMVQKNQLSILPFIPQLLEKFNKEQPK